MKIINTRLHGVLDYITGIILLIVPGVVYYDMYSPQVLVPAALGSGTLFYSILTNYELGLIRRLPMIVHLALDTASGVFLACSPWLFDFESVVFLPYLLAGCMEIVIVTLSSSKPFYKQPETLST